ncbi:MAG: hypothetical protein ACTHML_12135 [Ginsengibacter sp.]
MNTAINYADMLLTEFSGEPDVLRNNIKNYPASSLSHVLLLCHLKKNADPVFYEAAEQTGIYLQNPYWLEFQLSLLSKTEEKKANENISIPDSLGAPIFQEDEKTKAESSNGNGGDVGNVYEEAENENLLAPADDETFDLPKSENFVPISDSSNPSENNDFNEGTVQNEDAGFNEREGFHIDDTSEPAPVAVNQNANIENENSGLENIPEETNGNLTGSQAEEIVNDNEPILENTTVEIKEVTSGAQGSIDGYPESRDLDVDANIQAEEAAHKNDSSFAKEQNETDLEKKNEEDEIVSFEPLHTVDYFASQGIKLSEEALSNDQLGKQVKSFTAWLKSMKKLHPGHLPEQNEVIEKLIQTSSEASNQSVNVLTEAMAEVLVKQGKSEKAIEMYQKLSLLNPSKSAYFAAKIESIKSI